MTSSSRSRRGGDARDRDQRPGFQWPWLVQIGPSPRGGAYTYDWIENLLGVNLRSANAVLEEFQHAHVGDMISSGANRMRLERVDPQQVLSWRSEDGNWVWTFVLKEQGRRHQADRPNRFRLPTLMSKIGMLP